MSCNRHALAQHHGCFRAAFRRRRPDARVENHHAYAAVCRVHPHAWARPAAWEGVLNSQWPGASSVGDELELAAGTTARGRRIEGMRARMLAAAAAAAHPHHDRCLPRPGSAAGPCSRPFLLFQLCLPIGRQPHTPAAGVGMSTPPGPIIIPPALGAARVNMTMPRVPGPPSASSDCHPSARCTGKGESSSHPRTTTPHPRSK